MTQIRPAATKVTRGPLRALGADVSSAPKVGRLGDLKWCSRCKAHHDRSEFSRTWATADGLQGWCRKAMGEYRLARKIAEALA